MCRAIKYSFGISLVLAGSVLAYGCIGVYTKYGPGYATELQILDRKFISDGDCSRLINLIENEDFVKKSIFTDDETTITYFYKSLKNLPEEDYNFINIALTENKQKSDNGMSQLTRIKIYNNWRGASAPINQYIDDITEKIFQLLEEAIGEQHISRRALKTGPPI